VSLKVRLVVRLLVVVVVVVVVALLASFFSAFDTAKLLNVAMLRAVFSSSVRSAIPLLFQQLARAGGDWAQPFLRLDERGEPL
jgi:Na+/H+-dicarboxylate symporter